MSYARPTDELQTSTCGRATSACAQAALKVGGFDGLSVGEHSTGSQPDIQNGKLALHGPYGSHDDFGVGGCGSADGRAQSRKKRACVRNASMAGALAPGEWVGPRAPGHRATYIVQYGS